MMCKFHAPACRLEEAEVCLVAKQEANALLNSQVDLLTKQLRELQEGKAAYEKHFRDLSALLAKERRQRQPHQKQVHLPSGAAHCNWRSETDTCSVVGTSR